MIQVTEPKCILVNVRGLSAYLFVYNIHYISKLTISYSKKHAKKNEPQFDNLYN